MHPTLPAFLTIADAPNCNSQHHLVEDEACALRPAADHDDRGSRRFFPDLHRDRAPDGTRRRDRGHPGPPPREALSPGGRPRAPQRRGQVVDQHSPVDNDPAYEFVESYGYFRLVRAGASGRYYVSWYDAENRQTRRTSLRTNKPSDAHEKMRFLADLDIDGDPKAYLNKKQVKTVAELLDHDWEKYLHKIPSAEAAGIARDIIKREMGEKRLAALVPD